MTGLLERNGIGIADLVLPVALPYQMMKSVARYWHDGWNSYLLGAHNTQTNMAIVIPDGDKCLDPGPVANTGLLLQRHNLQNLILEGCPRKKLMISNSLMGREKR